MAAGVVRFVSGNGGMLVVGHEDGFALVEMLGSEGEVELGDTVSADWGELGSGSLRKGSEAFDVYFQGSWAAAEIPLRMARQQGGG